MLQLGPPLAGIPVRAETRNWILQSRSRRWVRARFAELFAPLGPVLTECRVAVVPGFQLWVSKPVVPVALYRCRCAVLVAVWRVARCAAGQTALPFARPPPQLRHFSRRHSRH